MKRFVALIMVVAVLFASSAYAESIVFEENFSIRNGILFGMKADEIDQIEKTNGNRSASSYSYLYPSSDKEYVTRLGGETCGLLYFFNEDKILSGFRYAIKEKGTYISVISSLSEKYGKENVGNRPLFETEVSQVSSVLTIMNPSVTVNGWWLVQYKDCYVYIVASTLEMDKTAPMYRVDYTTLSYDEVAAVLSLQDLLEQESKQSLEDGL